RPARRIGRGAGPVRRRSRPRPLGGDDPAAAEEARVVVTDLDASLIDAARRLTAEEGLAGTAPIGTVCSTLLAGRTASLADAPLLTRCLGVDHAGVGAPWWKTARYSFGEVPMRRWKAARTDAGAPRPVRRPMFSIGSVVVSSSTRARSI